MQAIMVKDEYVDLEPNCPYEVEKVYSENYIQLKRSHRRYKSGSFKLMHNGKKISHEEAYRLYKIEVVRKKLGMK